jgi:hypothetical protein
MHDRQAVVDRALVGARRRRHDRLSAEAAEVHQGGRVPGAPGSEMLAVLQAGETVSPVGASGGRTVIELHPDGTRFGDLLIQVISQSVRIRGGDVQVVLGGVR